VIPDPRAVAVIGSARQRHYLHVPAARGAVALHPRILPGHDRIASETFVTAQITPGDNILLLLLCEGGRFRAAASCLWIGPSAAAQAVNGRAFYNPSPTAARTDCHLNSGHYKSGARRLDVG
jgi:hypothetical protein